MNVTNECEDIILKLSFILLFTKTFFEKGIMQFIYPFCHGIKPLITSQLYKYTFSSAKVLKAALADINYRWRFLRLGAISFTMCKLRAQKRDLTQTNKKTTAATVPRDNGPHQMSIS
ncbi:zinc finger protein 777-like protein [Platysternon megacephalum]|uniref:Zinc finger protein 777-like protein n=1 Tax=Platysternon megacephalum TaxID=55544 RepID=A0A4D9E7X9_9SAUR|nr:zinc finger protein 777-like protein [Platysternon megacephalum]